MASESNHDLPADILEKLQNLELELEEGDITLKGFEKKKASLLSTVSPTPNSPQQDEAALLAELGPEPSAADVTDFLDFLPSPTHSPTRNDGAELMEQNHKNIQQQQQQQHQQQQQPQYQQQQYQQQYQQQQPMQPQYQQQQQQQVYQQPSPQYQPQYQAQQQQQQPPYQTNVYQGSPQARQNMIPGQYRPYPSSNNGRPINNNPIYYNNNSNNPIASPMPNNRPGYIGRPRPPQYYQYRPNGSPRPPQPQMYNSPRPMSTSPRPMYRPNPNNYRPGYAAAPAAPRPNDPYYVNRSLSTNSGVNTMRQGYTDRQQHSMSMYSTGSESEWHQ